jgi:hypothetical protein
MMSCCDASQASHARANGPAYFHQVFGVKLKEKKEAMKLKTEKMLKLIIIRSPDVKNSLKFQH